MKKLLFGLLGISLLLLPVGNAFAPCMPPPPIGGYPPMPPGPIALPPAGRPPSTETPDEETPPETPPDEGPSETPGDDPTETAPGEPTPDDPTEKPMPTPPPEEAPPADPPADPTGTPPPDLGGTGPGPEGRVQRPGRPGDRPRPRGVFGLAGSWSVWWNMSREDLLGLRNSQEGRTSKTEGGTDPLPALRARVREALRALVVREREESLRAAGLIALGRAGDEWDAKLFLDLSRSTEETSGIREAAALGLAGLPALADAENRAGVRDLYEDLLANRVRMSGKSRLLSVLALSMRAHDDPAIVRSLGARCARRVENANEAAVFLFACGLARDPLLGACLSEVVRSGKLGGDTVHDVARAHASLGLALCGEDGTYGALAETLTAKGTPLHTRRGAALALARILRKGNPGEETRAAAVKALLTAFNEDHDLLVRGFSAVALGGAKEPAALEPIRKEFEKRRDAVVRPFCALALGLAARGRETKEAVRIRKLLAAEARKAKDPDLAAAVCLAAGIARSEPARPLLLALAQDTHENPEVRGAACEALGLLGRTDAVAERALRRALLEKSPDLVFGAALGLGFLGTRTTGHILVSRLTDTRSESLQAHLVMALCHLGGGMAVEPLLEIARDRGERTATRRAAVIALGLLVDEGEKDPLFEIDASLNPYGLIIATRELVKVF